MTSTELRLQSRGTDGLHLQKRCKCWSCNVLSASPGPTCRRVIGSAAWYRSPSLLVPMATVQPPYLPVGLANLWDAPGVDDGVDGGVGVRQEDTWKRHLDRPVQMELSEQLFVRVSSSYLYITSTVRQLEGRKTVAGSLSGAVESSRWRTK